MSLEPSITPEISEMIGKLCVSADAACRSGDFERFRDLARQLAAYISEPLHCELDAVLASPVTTLTARWDDLKDRVYREAS